MSNPTAVPGPRHALDEGSVHDLAVDGAQVLLAAPTPTALGLAPAAAAPVVVPEDASVLLAGWSQYGS